MALQKEEGYEKIKFITLEKLRLAESTKKYSIESTAQEAIKHLDNNEVLAIKISVNSPVKVINACPISDVDTIDQFVKEIDDKL